jgi:hypothetical protein
LRNVVELDTYLKDTETTQGLVARAFNKCVESVEGSEHVFGSAELTEQERRCITEYVSLYSFYCRGGYRRFMDLYNQMQMKQQEQAMAMQQRMGGGGGGH